MQEKVQILQYADDIALYNVERGDQEQQKKPKEATEQIEKQLEKLGLELEYRKTQYIVFCKEGDQENAEKRILKNRNLEQRI